MGKPASDKESTYLKISQILRAEIRQGVFLPFRSLPSEKEIAQRFGVAVLTIRRAFDVLVNEGLIEKHRGKRAMVCPPKQTELLAVHPNSSAQYFQAKEPLTYATVFQAKVNPTPELREILMIPWAVDQVVKVTRTRNMNGRVISAYDVYFKASADERILAHELKNESILLKMRNEWGMVPSRIIHQIEACPSEKETAKLLDIKPGKMIYILKTTEYDKDEVPYCHFMEYFQLDRYKFQINIESNSATAKR